ncbi:MAG TPA: hypothetical protein VLK36_17250 [Gaiellaceae bacterium]|nr:hypothetical protein [Gaiellaceae bacterium]
MTLRGALRAFGRFWWEFVVGDDWKIAAGVASALGVGAVLAATASVDAGWVAPVAGCCVLLAFAIVVVADVRGRAR